MYDLAIIGGGVTGTGTAYIASKYTDIGSILLIDKENWWGSINSSSTSNSQSLHTGNKESNFSEEKARKLRVNAGFVASYVENHLGIAKKGQDMLLGVGDDEIKVLQERYAWAKDVYPGLLYVEGSDVGLYEPNVTLGRTENVAALVSDSAYTVDYGKLAASFVEEADATGKLETLLGAYVRDIEGKKDHYEVAVDGKTIVAKNVVVAAGAHTIMFAHAQGVATDYYELPVAGRFFYTPECLNGKVYTVQKPGLPFAAVHGDPDLSAPGKTRWGPTAWALPVLETKSSQAYWRRVREFMQQVGDSPGDYMLALKNTFNLFKDPTISGFLLDNLRYLGPGKERAFLEQVRKIVPTAELESLVEARDEFGDLVGGVRPQLVHRETGEMPLGVGRFVDGGIIYNVTPSPGATNCLGEGLSNIRDLSRMQGLRFRNEDFLADHTPLNTT